MAAVALIVLLGAASASARPASLDNAFGQSGIVTVTSSFDSAADVVGTRDGRLVVLGARFVSGSGYLSSALGFRADGQPDETYGESGPGYTDFPQIQGVMRIVGEQDGKLVLVGTGSDPGNLGGAATIRFARLLPDGSHDPGFGSGGVVDTGIQTFGGVDAAMTSDGRIVATTPGPYDSQTFLPTGAQVMRFQSNGSLDPTFSSDGIAVVDDSQFDTTSDGPVVALPNGDVVVAGSVYRTPQGLKTHSRSVLFRLTSAGDLDTAFGDAGFQLVPENQAYVSDIATTSSGRIVTAGQVPTDYRGVDTRPQVLAYKPSGKLVGKFGDGGVATIRGAGLGAFRRIAIDSDGSIIAVGYGQTNPFDQQEDGGTGSDILISRLTPKGFPDRTFAPRGVLTTGFGDDTATAFGLALQFSGRIVVLGTHGQYFFRGPSESTTILAGYDPGTGGPDADQDGFSDRLDQCRALPGVVRGCPDLERAVTLRAEGGRFSGRVRSDTKACLKSAEVRLVRERGGSSSTVGVDRSVDKGRYRIDAPKGPGVYTATVSRHLLPRVGICSGARSEPLELSR
jgi:uncharacterized delta-60 repeat protein